MMRRPWQLLTSTLIFTTAFVSLANGGGLKDRQTTESGTVATTTVGARDSRLPIAPDRPVPSRQELVSLVERLAARHGLDLDLVHAVIRAESAYNPNAVSHAGAVGLMQVMPATAADYGVHSVDALFDPKINLETGMRHFKRLLDKYGSIGHAVMAYNAGEGALERSGGFVTYAETQRYTHGVVVSYLNKKGVRPYTPQARRVIGLEVTPAMAHAAEQRTGAELAQVAPEAPERRQLTRLSSRLSPELSKSPDSGRGLGLSRAGQTTSGIETSRPRVATNLP
ncbi:lytic transglycosylase domain-containing protein [Thiocapsa imhoffii]|nr:lytic transglycosylase domain-containing protein [Thiocapsa imhoffii]